jgi:hypothetical protein
LVALNVLLFVPMQSRRTGSLSWYSVKYGGVLLLGGVGWAPSDTPSNASASAVPGVTTPPAGQASPGWRV